MSLHDSVMTCARISVLYYTIKKHLDTTKSI